MTVADATFREQALVAPQPIALSCGRIARAHTPQERLDTVIKAAEVLTRYLAAASIASFAARTDKAVQPPACLQGFAGNLSFGHFLTVVQCVADLPCDYPLKPFLTTTFAMADGRRPLADQSLSALLQLRNRLGHNLSGMSEARAATEFAERAPDRSLVTALRELDAILRLPLFLVESQEAARRRITARRLLLMSESPDPMPDEVELSAPLDYPRALYLGVPGGALLLYPLMRWGLAVQRANYGIYFLHAIGDRDATFVTVYDDRLDNEREPFPDIRMRLAGDLLPVESVQLPGGKDFVREWRERRRAIEQAREQAPGVVPWEQCDPTTVRWYASRLGQADSDDEARALIAGRLLDGRDELEPAEIRQLLLLLGTPEIVRGLVRRPVLDLRSRKNSGKGRFSERIECQENVVQSLRAAIDFLGRHIDLEPVTLDEFHRQEGSPDYVAVREALVNLVVHQDYSSTQLAGQVEIAQDRAAFFNAGRSLVRTADLFQGARSQSRNPLLSRALKLIGFAELAGSGLREVDRVWREARRRLPEAQSDTGANTFTLVLDWRPLPDDSVEFWKRRLGVSISQLEAEILRLAAEPDGTTATALAKALTETAEQVRVALDALQVKQLVSLDGQTVRTLEHLIPVVQEANATSAVDT